MNRLYTFAVILLLKSSTILAAPFSTVLLTGGNGYIGSHIAVELAKEGYHVVIVDNLVNSKELVQERIKQIAGDNIHLDFYPYDLRDKDKLEEVFQKHKIDAVIHLAGLKAVGESVAEPLKYYDNNIVSSVYLLEVMDKYNCHNFIFSSSATVYGVPKYLPLNEEHSLGAINPYGRTKLQIEEILTDVAASKNEWRIISLRYFNPSGSHASGLIGEDPQGIPNCLMPYILQVVVGKRERVRVFGGDYPTKDGTGVRDFIHVVDLAKGHLATLHKLENDDSYSGHKFYNLGTGNGYSVLEMIQAVSDEVKRPVPYEIIARRPGDAAEVYANPSLAEAELNWKAEFGLKEMVRDCVNWILKNPDGYNVEESTSNSNSN